MDNREETETILGCLSAPPPTKVQKRKFTVRDIGSDDLTHVGEGDAVVELVKKSKPKRGIVEWTGLDFLRYLDKNLNLYSISLVSADSRDSDVINTIYDRIVNHLQSDMNNVVLRDYFDWWVGNFAALYQTKGWSIHIRTFIKDQYIDGFAEQWRLQNDIKEETRVVQDISIDDQTLYDQGGLSILLMNRGIVKACRILDEAGELDPARKVSKTLVKFAEKVLRDSMEQTLNYAPYSNTPIDFMSIIRPALDSRGIDAYNNIDFRDYFGGKINFE